MGIWRKQQQIPKGNDRKKSKCKGKGKWKRNSKCKCNNSKCKCNRGLFGAEGFYWIDLRGSPGGCGGCDGADKNKDGG
jgi:hypothetical protein